MSREQFSIVYDGDALRGGVMDVRDLAPALMALGQMFDAANKNLNGDTAHIKLQVRATEIGSFEILFELVQNWSSQVLHFFAGPEVSGATNLLTCILGGSTGVSSLIWLVKKLKGRNPERIERQPNDVMRLIIGDEHYDVPNEILRLFQDIAVRDAMQKVVQEPLFKSGIDTFSVKKEGVLIQSVPKTEAEYFSKPSLPDETLVDAIRRSAFSIVSLTFKEDNKWRLFDGNTQISATIADEDFIRRVDNNQVSFSKGDILLCDVRITQRRTSDGLKSDYVVEHVVEHRPATRQLPLPLPE